MTPALITVLTTALISIIGAVAAAIVAVQSHGKITAQAMTLVHNTVSNPPRGARMTVPMPLTTTTDRTMYDGINADAVVIAHVYRPGNLVCFYSAGNSYIWTQAEKNLFPPSALVGITLTHTYTGPGSDVLDVEAGGATVSQIHDWIKAKKAQGYDRPTIYCSKSIIPAVRSATAEYVLATDYDIWEADWDGSTAPDYPRAAAKQERNAGPYDVSVVFDPEWPHRTKSTPPPPPPPPPPSPPPHTGTKTVVSEQHTLSVPVDCDHVVVIPYAIVNGAPKQIPGWRIPA